MEQLNWILEGQISIEAVSRLRRIMLSEFHTSVDLFPTSEMLEIFDHCVSNIGMFYPFPQHCNGLVSML